MERKPRKAFAVRIHSKEAISASGVIYPETIFTFGVNEVEAMAKVMAIKMSIEPNESFTSIRASESHRQMSGWPHIEASALRTEKIYNQIKKQKGGMK
ncbi:MAG: hypothetical protein NC396_08535 [Bacteroides sp.]|nr:hypothetical protein [Bacteroides sp.]MCM1085108.1 hypothetical protein [Bacteroides sp.]